MAEWSKAVDSKSTVGQLTGGSNPSLSANLSTWLEMLRRCYHKAGIVSDQK